MEPSEMHNRIADLMEEEPEVWEAINFSVVKQAVENVSLRMQLQFCDDVIQCRDEAFAEADQDESMFEGNEQMRDANPDQRLVYTTLVLIKRMLNNHAEFLRENRGRIDWSGEARQIREDAEARKDH